jgi:hypothetical protein
MAVLEIRRKRDRETAAINTERNRVRGGRGVNGLLYRSGTLQ